jgi:hypothetical protein
MIWIRNFSEKDRKEINANTHEGHYTIIVEKV